MMLEKPLVFNYKVTPFSKEKVHFNTIVMGVDENFYYGLEETNKVTYSKLVTSFAGKGYSQHKIGLIAKAVLNISNEKAYTDKLELDVEGEQVVISLNASNKNGCIPTTAIKDLDVQAIIDEGYCWFVTKDTIDDYLEILKTEEEATVPDDEVLQEENLPMNGSKDAEEARLSETNQEVLNHKNAPAKVAEMISALKFDDNNNIVEESAPVGITQAQVLAKYTSSEHVKEEEEVEPIVQVEEPIIQVEEPPLEEEAEPIIQVEEPSLEEVVLDEPLVRVEEPTKKVNIVAETVVTASQSVATVVGHIKEEEVKVEEELKVEEEVKMEEQLVKEPMKQVVPVEEKAPEVEEKTPEVEEVEVEENHTPNPLPVETKEEEEEPMEEEGNGTEVVEEETTDVLQAQLVETPYCEVYMLRSISGLTATFVTSLGLISLTAPDSTFLTTSEYEGVFKDLVESVYELEETKAGSEPCDFSDLQETITTLLKLTIKE